MSAGALRDLPYAVMTRHAEAGQEITTSVPVLAEADQEAGHIDPAAAARWHQAQSELASLIREENQAIGQGPEAQREALLPDSLADWLAMRVAQLEHPEAIEPEIDPIG